MLDGMGGGTSSPHATAEYRTPLLPPSPPSNDPQQREPAHTDRRWYNRIPGATTTRKAIATLDSLPGGHPAVGAFVLSLIAYTAQSESAAWVQSGLHYPKPVLSLYLVHSSFSLILPMHLTALHWTTRKSIRSYYLPRLHAVIRWHMRALPVLSRPRHHADAVAAEDNQDAAASVVHEMWSTPPEHISNTQVWERAFAVATILTFGIGVPAMGWYAAVPLTRMADITALYNCFALAALVLSVWILGEEWRMYKVLATAAAVGGVVVTAYGGSETEDKTYPHALLGDLLALFGAISMGFYEVLFKLLGTLPSANMLPSPSTPPNPDAEQLLAPPSESQYTDMDTDTDTDTDTETDTGATDTDYDSAIKVDEDEPKSSPNQGATVVGTSDADASSSSSSRPNPKPPSDEEVSRLPSINEHRTRTSVRRSHHERWESAPPKLPFGLHASLVTSAIGVCTFGLLWIMVLVAHVMSWEQFELPQDPKVYLALASGSIFGLLFNGCFSILLGLWGPVLASVSCLLTTILVQAADALLGSPPTLMGLIGCSLILLGFCVLVWGESKHTIAPRRRRKKRRVAMQPMSHPSSSTQA